MHAEAELSGKVMRRLEAWSHREITIGWGSS